MSCRLDGGVSDPLCVNFAVLIVGRSIVSLLSVFLCSSGIIIRILMSGGSSSPRWCSAV